MSYDICLFAKEVPDEIIPEFIRILNNFEMTVEIHPEFSFLDHNGYLPFKFNFTKPPLVILKDKNLQSGFELYIDDYTWEPPVLNSEPKRSFIDKLLNRKAIKAINETGIPNDRLMECTKELTFCIHSGDDFELRFGLLSSAILAEILDGVCFNPEDGTWPANQNLSSDVYKEIKEYESGLTEDEIEFNEFDGWR